MQPSSDHETSANRKGLYGGAIPLRRENAGVRLPRGELLLDPFGDEAAVLAFRAWVEQAAALEVEIGFGRGRFLSAHAAAHPEMRVLGFEVRTRACEDLMRLCVRRGIGSVRVVQADARPVIEQQVRDGSVRAFHINFPDPWWKKRHHKRRVFCPDFVAVLHRKLASGGSVCVRTDVGEYAELIRGLFRAHGGFEERPLPPGELPPTWRERQCDDFGLPVHRHRFVRCETPPGGAA